MESVAIRPPDDPGQIDSLFASSSRAGPVSDDIVAAASAEGRVDAPNVEADSAEEDPQASRQEEALHGPELNEQQQNAEGIPGFDEMPELASMRAAPEVRQALGSPGAREQHQAALAEAPRTAAPAQDSSGASSASQQAGGEPKSMSSPSSGVVDDREASEGVASPASSSADAPGSDYDDLEHRHLVPETNTLVCIQDGQRSTSPTPIRDRVDAVKGARDVTELTPERSEEQQSESSEAIYEALQVPDPTPVQLSQAIGPDPSEKQVISEAYTALPQEPRDEEGWSLRISALLGEIEERPNEAGTTKQETPQISADGERSGASNPPQSQLGQVNQPEERQSPKSLVRPSEEAIASNSKRQRLDDPVSPTEMASFPPDIAAASAKKESSAEKDEKPAPKLKALPKSKAAPKAKAEPKAKKQVKSKTKKAAEEAESSGEPTLCPIVEHTSGPATSHESVSSPEEATASVAAEREALPAKVRKASARPRKQPTKDACGAKADPKTASHPNPGQASDSAVVNALSQPMVSQSEAAEAAPTEPAPKGKAKARFKAQASTKGKAKTLPDAVSPASVTTETAQATAVTVGATKKPATKRTTAKKAKDPAAKLRPAQADGAVSELELEPSANQQPVEQLTPFAEAESVRNDRTVSDNASHRGAAQSEHAGIPSGQRDTSTLNQQGNTIPQAPTTVEYSSGYTSSNIFTSMPPPLYPAQTYYPTRAEIVQQQTRGLSSLTRAASMVDSDSRWAESSVPRRDSSVSVYEGVNEPTSPTTAANTTGSMAGDAVSDATSFSPDQSMNMMELDPRMFPPGWRVPVFDLMDPDRLMTTMRDKTVWTFWDCYLPLGCRDQDMVLMSNDGIAFPCAAWNPCLFSSMLRRVIKNPSPNVRHIMQRNVTENRRLLGYAPLPCIWIDENWHATNLLLSFLHPIPNMFLPDRATCRIVLELGMRYGVERAVSAATQRSTQLDEEDRFARMKGKGKARSTEEEIAADLAECAEEMRD